jgi:hypothetical protein
MAVEIESATFGRKFSALIVDWGASGLITRALVSQHAASQSFFQLLVFFVEASILTTLTGASFGQHLLRLRVVDEESGGTVAPLRVLARTAMICLVLPAIFVHQGRGYHEILTHTRVIRLKRVL